MIGAYDHPDFIAILLELGVRLCFGDRKISEEPCRIRPMGHLAQGPRLIERATSYSGGPTTGHGVT